MASEIRDTTASYSDASQAHWEGAKVVYGDTDSVFVWGSQNAVDRRGRDGRGLKDPETM
jgi:DNA polymerase elongation subunit (family B)